MTLMILTHNSDFMDGHIRDYIADCKRFAKEEAALRLKELEQSLRSMSPVSLAILNLIPDDEEADHYIKRLRFYKDKVVIKRDGEYVVGMKRPRIRPQRQNKTQQGKPR